MYARLLLLSEIQKHGLNMKRQYTLELLKNYNNYNIETSNKKCYTAC